LLLRLPLLKPETRLHGRSPADSGAKARHLKPHFRNKNDKKITPVFVSLRENFITPEVYPQSGMLYNVRLKLPISQDFLIDSFDNLLLCLKLFILPRVGPRPPRRGVPMVL
jgi:hypothetical protein